MAQSSDLTNEPNCMFGDDHCLTNLQPPDNWSSGRLHLLYLLVLCACVSVCARSFILAYEGCTPEPMLHCRTSTPVSWSSSCSLTVRDTSDCRRQAERCKHNGFCSMEGRKCPEEDRRRRSSKSEPQAQAQPFKNCNRPLQGVVLCKHAAPVPERRSQGRICRPHW